MACRMTVTTTSRLTRLARLEAVIAFRELLRRFPDLTLAVNASEPHWNHGDGLVMRGLSSLPVSLH